MSRSRGSPGESARDQDALLLAAGQVAKAAAGLVGHAHPQQRVRGLPAIGCARPVEETEPTVATHQRHLGDREGERRRQPDPLGNVADRVGPFRGPAAEDRRLATSGPVEPQQDAQEGALAGAVGADERDEGCLRHLEADVLEHGLAVVGEPDVPRRDGRCTAHDPPTSARTICSVLKRIRESIRHAPPPRGLPGGRGRGGAHPSRPPGPGHRPRLAAAR